MSLSSADIRQYLLDQEDLESDQFDPGTALFSTGILDSFAMVSLVSFIEKSCGVRVKATEVTLENFDSIDRILEFVDTKKP